MTYKAGESGVIVTGLSSDPGQGTIIASRDYERQFSAHLVRFFTCLNEKSR